MTMRIYALLSLLALGACAHAPREKTERRFESRRNQAEMRTARTSTPLENNRSGVAPPQREIDLLPYKDPTPTPPQQPPVK